MIRLASGVGFAVHDLRIVEHTRSWSESEGVPGYRVVFVRRGLFRLNYRGWDGLVDPLMAYVRLPGDEQRIAHRPEIEDLCTVLTLDEALATEVMHQPPPIRPLITNGRIDLAQRSVVARARQDADGFELAERVTRLAEELFRLTDESPTVRGSSAPSHRRLAESAREVLTTNPAWPTFEGLAHELGISRSHLSRVFRAETGESLTKFRSRLRVRAALDSIEAGDINLARLAAELGFADHAHLTRTMRAELGSPPSRVRAMLNPRQLRSHTFKHSSHA